MSTTTRRCCTASAAGSSSTPTRATLILDPETGWCCHHTLVMQPLSAQRVCAALKRPATVRPFIDKMLLRVAGVEVDAQARWTPRTHRWWMSASPAVSWSAGAGRGRRQGCAGALADDEGMIGDRWGVSDS